MTCNDFERQWLENVPLSGEAHDHAAGCGKCRALMAAFDMRRDVPNAAVIARIENSITSSLEPVKPLGSDSGRALVLVCVFGAFVIAVSGWTRFWAVARLALPKEVVYYSLILVLAALLARAVAEETVPGTRRNVRSKWLMVATVVVLLVAIPVLFPAFDVTEFVNRGMPCLQLGMACAVACSAVVTLLLRRGLMTSPVETGAVGGLLCGLAGFAVLALHCSIFTAPHVWMWHLGPMLLAAVVGAGVGVAVERRA